MAPCALDATSTPGNAVIDFSSSTAIPSGVDRLGGLVATVPNSAGLVYKSKALLHFSSVVVNGAAATGDDAVDVDAYFGDSNGDGVLSGGDASDISRVASGVDNNSALGIIGGFSAYPLADPVLIGDLSGSGSVGAASVTLLNSFLSGTPRTQIPALPTGITIVTTAPDPSLSLGRAELIPLYATPGSTVIVPVNIDTARLAGSTGMLEAILAVKYDPTEFTVSAGGRAVGQLAAVRQRLAAANGDQRQDGRNRHRLVQQQSHPNHRRWQPRDDCLAGTPERAGGPGGSEPGEQRRSHRSAGLHHDGFGCAWCVLMVQETALAQPGAILNSDLEAQTGSSDQTLTQQVGVAQHDWVPADMVAYLGQATKAGLRSPDGDLLDGLVGQDAGDLAGVEESFARAATGK